jgi:HEAT repeat protein
LGDVTAVPELLQRLPTEPDEGLRLAYAAALGQLQATEATPLILKLLADTEEETAQAELALSLARMVGEEHSFVQLLRQSSSDPGTALAHELLSLAKKWQKAESDISDSYLNESAVSLSLGNLEEGIQTFNRFVTAYPATGFTAVEYAILEACASGMNQFGAARLEYMLLALLVLNRQQTGNST